MLKVFGVNAHDFSRSYVPYLRISEVGESRCLACHCVCTVFFTNHYGCASQFVACGNNFALVGEHQKGARTFHLAINVLNALNNGFTLHNEQSHKLRLVGFARGKFGKVLLVFEHLVFQLADVCDFSHSNNGKSSEMRVYDYWLGICVAYDPYAGVSLEFVKLVFELAAEISVFEIMYASLETLFLGECCHSGASCAEMSVIVCAVKQIVYARTHGYCSEKSSHKL